MKYTILLLVAVGIAGCNQMTARGEKVGTVIKFAQEGYFVKTWEGEMIRGGMNGGSGAFSTTPLHFTVMNESLVPQVQEAFENQKEVVVTYEEHALLFTFTSECHDGCKFLTSIHERGK